MLIDKYGYSTLAETINSGKCPHVLTAGVIYNKNIGEGTKDNMGDITKEERQFAKIANFGYPANMSTSTFVDYCRGMDIFITEEEALAGKEAFKQSYPEIVQYWDLREEYGNVDYFDHYTLTGRKRAKCTYTAYLNTGFQGLAADGIKLAMYECLKQGITLVGMIHDQLLAEVEKGQEEKTMQKLQNIMVSSMKILVKDVNIDTEGQFLERFSK